VRAEPATGHEGEALEAIVERARWARHEVAEVCADQGYASDAVYRALAARGVTAYIPPQRNMRHTTPGQEARKRCKSPPGVAAAIERMTHGEGAISELKLRHGLDRARCRGTPKLSVQLLLAATAINLKRLLSRPSAAEDGQAGDRGHRHAVIGRRLQILNACLRWLRRDEPAGSLTGS